MKNFYFLILIYSQFTFSQEWTHFTPSDNLINGAISSIEKFNDDYYVGTWVFLSSETTYGLGKFDGTNWVKISDPNLHNEVSSLLNDNNGNLWIGTHNGLTKFDGNQFIKFTTSNGLPSNFINSVKKDADGKIWIATNNGVVTYENNIFTTIPQLIGKPVYTLEFVDTGIVWFSVHNEGIYVKNLNSWSVLSTINGLSSNSPFVLKKGADSDVWIGHYIGFSSNSLDRYNLSNLSMTNYYLANGLPDFYVRAIEKDLNGNIYIGTNNGLSRFNGTTFETLNYNGPLESNIIRSLFLMGSELWIGTFAGVSKNSTFLNLDDFKKVNEISIYPNPSNNLISIYKLSNNTDDFLYKIIDMSGRTLLNGSSKFMEQISIESLIKGNYILQIEVINGEKWTQKLIKH